MKIYKNSCYLKAVKTATIKYKKKKQTNIKAVDNNCRYITAALHYRYYKFKVLTSERCGKTL